MGIVSVPALPWPVRSSRAHGSGDPMERTADTKRRLEDSPANRHRCVRWTRGSSRGSTRGYSRSVVAASPRSDPPVGVAGGGDEETRTPDPLLAKEMLYQLSYVPLRRACGGRFWTRTRDLCLIRAVL